MDLLPSGDAMAIKIVLGELPEAKPELNERKRRRDLYS
jgi:hypothetical protein